MQLSEDVYLAHYGVLRRSGRYPWGSGGPEYASNKSFLGYVQELRKAGLTDVEVARGMGISTTELRAAKSIAVNEERQATINMIQRLKDKGNANTAIAERLNIPESTVRALLKTGENDDRDVLTSTSEMLKRQVEEKKYLDVGSGVESQLGIASTKLNTALAVLKEQGYEVHDMKIQQVGTGQYTNYKVLALPGTTRSEVFANRDQLKQITDFSDDGGRSYLGLHPPLSIDPKRVGINYAENGGKETDGVIYVRPGVPDVSLGNSRYAQVRVQVGDGHYLKGMAMYKDDLPDGVDLVFNTNKSDTGNKLDAMKGLKKNQDGTVDKDNPFGAVVSQLGVRDSEGSGIVRQLVGRNSDGSERVTSAMNIVNQEGDWGKWSKSLSTQMLSKQSPTLARTQLDMTYERRKDEFERLSSLTNPTIRRDLLLKFGDETDSAAVHLKAAALPRQASRVILPISSMKPGEIYAPGYRDGERVALIRYPHGGKFEIPELIVNNKHPEARALLGKEPKDAVGIHHSVAERLSGADFDGDTVLVIPNGTGKVKATPALEGLKKFDPKHSYPPYDGMKTMDGGTYRASSKSVEYGPKGPSSRIKQQQMGDVSNLITDMTIKGASTVDVAAAVRHSMVVIDAEKHSLDYKQSAIDNGISALKEKYQGKKNAGASTLISRATSEQRVPERKERNAAAGGPIDKATGKRVFVETGNSYTDSKGRLVLKKDSSVKLAETDDAHTLSSGTPIERLYADHSNRLKALANTARKEAVNTPNSKYSPSAKKVYAAEAKSLDAKLSIALRNAPLERQAQVVANTIIKAKKDQQPEMDAASLKKIKAQALNEARNRTGAKKNQIHIEDKEWEAIQAGAISDSKLTRILANADIDRVRELATPKSQLLMTSAKTSRAKSMLASGYTRAEVADALGVSVTTLDTVTGGDE